MSFIYHWVVLCIDGQIRSQSNHPLSASFASSIAIYRDEYPKNCAVTNGKLSVFGKALTGL